MSVSSSLAALRLHSAELKLSHLNCYLILEAVNQPMRLHLGWNELPKAPLEVCLTVIVGLLLNSTQSSELMEQDTSQVR